MWAGASAIRALDYQSKGPGGFSPPTAFHNLGNLLHPTLLVSLGGDIKNHLSLLPGVIARGSESYTQGNGAKKTDIDNGVSIISALSRQILVLCKTYIIVIRCS